MFRKQEGAPSLCDWQLPVPRSQTQLSVTQTTSSSLAANSPSSQDVDRDEKRTRDKRQVRDGEVGGGHSTLPGQGKQ